MLTGPDHAPIAVGSHDWENQFVDRIWTYSLDAVWAGLQQCYAALAADVRQRYDVELTTVGALGVSAMMHGYLAFDADGELLTPFRTWRNTNTGEAAERLSAEFGHNIPHRWSVAHLYQAILNGEDHVGRIAHLTTLAGYVHWQLTGEKVLGIGDASGMFPIDIATGSYDAGDAGHVRQPRRRGRERTCGWPTCCPRSGSPGSRPASSPNRARSCSTRPGGCVPAPRCARPRATPGPAWWPPTRSRRAPATSAPAPASSRWSCSSTSSAACTASWTWSPPRPGTWWRWCTATTVPASSTPGSACSPSSPQALGAEADTSTIFETLFTAALDGAPDGGGLMAYNYLSGEPITELDEGRPLFLRTPDSPFNLANFMRAQLFASLATLRIGMDVLQKDEGVRLDRMFAHGGLFKTKGVAQGFLAAAIDTPVSVGDVAAEGGAWGIAVLAAFRAGRTPGQSLADFLDTQVFADSRPGDSRPRPGRRRRLRRLHPALRRRAAGGTGGRRAQLMADDLGELWKDQCKRRARAGSPDD